MDLIAVAHILIHLCWYYINGCRCQTNGDIRLVGGDSPVEGRVEVYFGGRWGTICDDLWDDQDATVVCRQLGLSNNGTAVFHAAFGRGSGTIWLDNLECSGNENNLQECSYPGLGSHNCDHSEDAGVYCINDWGRIRLRNGLSSKEGRVEVLYDGQWGTVCDDDWDDTDAAIVCRQLGFNGIAVSLESARFGPGSGTIWLDDVVCTGIEETLQECTSLGWGAHNCDHSEDAGVRCDTDAMEDDVTKGTSLQTIRLVGGSVKNEGRVEVFISDRWGTVCDDDWDDKDAVVVCRQLGFNTGGTAIPGAAFGKGSGEILLDDVDCSGEETNLTECRRSTEHDDCDHGEDASVRCNDIRLSYGQGLSEGRVEVYYDGQWGTVCDKSWNDVDAQVVCSQLGFSSRGRAVLRSYVGSIASRMRLHNVNCTGRETSLLYCDNAGWSNEKCHSAEDVGVSCLVDNESCLNTPCLNGGTCITLTEGYACVCLDGFYGDNCDIEREDMTADKAKGFPIFISLVCVLMFGAIVYITVWMRRLKVSLDSQALRSIEMAKTNDRPQIV